MQTSRGLDVTCTDWIMGRKCQLRNLAESELLSWRRGGKCWQKVSRDPRSVLGVSSDCTTNHLSSPGGSTTRQSLPRLEVTV